VKIVGLCGYAQSGKDTLAKMLVEKEGFERRAFADLMKEMLLRINPYVRYANDYGVSQYITVEELVNVLGWEEAKKYSNVRQMLQRLGTEAGRDILGENVWVNAVFETFTGEKLAISDVRFPNEAEEIRNRGGAIVRIVREGFGPVNGHVSETAFKGQDIIIYNQGTPQDMLDEFRRFEKDFYE
jgi:hypothetical protein